MATAARALRRSSWLRLASSCWRLVRPGLLATVLFSMGVAALAAAEPPRWPQLAHALLGTGLVIAGAFAMNQLIEQRDDAKMSRTASRPLPLGRLSSTQVATLAAILSLAGLGWLAVLAPPVVTLLAAVSWILYVVVYTPLKRVTVWHVPVGAVAGAMPVFLGAATAGAPFTPLALALFGVVFFWQFSHTAAVGWIYRGQYASGRMKVAAVVDPSGRLAGRVALVGAVGLLLVGLVPAALSWAVWPYGVVALLLGLAELGLAAGFCARRTEGTARALWRMSLIHLPALLASLLVWRC